MERWLVPVSPGLARVTRKVLPKVLAPQAMARYQRVPGGKQQCPCAVKGQSGQSGP